MDERERWGRHEATAGERRCEDKDEAVQHNASGTSKHVSHADVWEGLSGRVR